MVITSKPHKRDAEIIKKIISNGGGVQEDNSKKEWTAISLRITQVLLDEIGLKVEERVGISRNAWILEAIQDKLERSD